jgi:hypothetical protein
MYGSRRIFFSKECDAAALLVGGYERIDCSLDAIWDALLRNPYGFPKIECDWFSARYIVTKPFMDSPALVWIFVIELDGDVIIDNVEEYQNY